MEPDEIVGQALAKLDDEADPNAVDATFAHVMLDEFSGKWGTPEATNLNVAFAHVAKMAALGGGNPPTDITVVTQTALSPEQQDAFKRAFNMAPAANTTVLSAAGGGEWPSPIGPRVEVTDEMIAAAKEILDPYFSADGSVYDVIFRAMHAAAPVPLVSEAEDRIAALQKELGALCAIRATHAGFGPHGNLGPAPDWYIDLIKERDLAREAVASLSRAMEVLERKDIDREADSHSLKVTIEKQARLFGAACQEIARLKSMLPAEGSGPDYHGPVKDGEAVPDPVHEQFHRAVGDVLAGKVMSKARDQMRKALDGVPAEKAAPNIVTRSDDPRRMGLGR